MDEPTLKLNIKLKELLKQHDLSMRELGKRTGIAESTLSGYLHGAEPSKLGHVRKLCRYFNMSMEELLYDECPPERLNIPPGFTGWIRVRVDEVRPDGKI